MIEKFTDVVQRPRQAWEEIVRLRVALDKIRFLDHEPASVLRSIAEEALSEG